MPSPRQTRQAGVHTRPLHARCKRCGARCTRLAAAFCSAAWHSLRTQPRPKSLPWTQLGRQLTRQQHYEDRGSLQRVTIEQSAADASILGRSSGTLRATLPFVYPKQHSRRLLAPAKPPVAARCSLGCAQELPEAKVNAPRTIPLKVVSLLVAHERRARLRKKADQQDGPASEKSSGPADEPPLGEGVADELGTLMAQNA